MDQDFIEALQNRTNQDNLRSRVHFNSFNNLKEGFERIERTEKSNHLSIKLLEYKVLLEERTEPISKMESLGFYREYIVPAGLHLILEEKYMSVYGFHRFIHFGIILDVLFFAIGYLEIIYYFPIFTLILTILGDLKKRKAKREKRYFGQGW